MSYTSCRVTIGNTREACIVRWERARKQYQRLLLVLRWHVALNLKVMNYRRNHVASNAVVKMEEQQQMEKILSWGRLFQHSNALNEEPPGCEPGGFVETPRRACTHKSRLQSLVRNDVCGLRRKLRRFSDAVATSREDHHPPRSGPAVQHRRWGRGHYGHQWGLPNSCQSQSSTPKKCCATQAE
jgi:hypothetical protein